MDPRSTFVRGRKSTKAAGIITFPPHFPAHKTALPGTLWPQKPHFPAHKTALPGTPLGTRFFSGFFSGSFRIWSPPALCITPGRDSGRPAGGQWRPDSASLHRLAFQLDSAPGSLVDPHQATFGKDTFASTGRPAGATPGGKHPCHGPRWWVSV